MSRNTSTLAGPNLDFWLIGGGSILFYFLALIFSHFRSVPSIDQQFVNIGVVMGFLALFVNNPHFIISYKLSYSRGFSFLRQHYFCLVIVPLVLLVFFTLSFLRMAGDGKQILSWMVQLLYLTVGWHYTKQSFGCTLVYARYENYPVDNRQRLLLRYQLFTIWWLAGVYSNIGESRFKYYSLPYSSFNLSRSLYWATMVIWGVLTLAVVYDVFWRNYKNNGRWPSATTLAPWVAMNLWWHPVFREETYYMFVVAFFHSLQYLAFVYRIESHRLEEEHHGPMPLPVNIFYLSGILFVSWLWFDLVPNQLDLKLDTLGIYNVEFFIVAATLFINIHHYFLDHVLWRFDNIEVRRFLLPATTPTEQQ